jgi:PD-(D/E)XK nuclease superfamily protein
LIEVILDASQLEVIEKCPYNWYLSYIKHLETRRTNPALSTGSFFHECLKFYYGKGQPLSNNIRETLLYARELACGDARIRWPEVAKDPKFFLYRLKDCIYKWLEQDEAMEIIGVEKGFSTLLYENSRVRFILEGMIDLVSRKNIMGLTVTDHKTQSRYYEKYEYNHQIMNYMSFTGAEYFEYNYIGLQDTITKTTFFRPVFKPPEGMLAQWKQDVIHTFMGVADMLERANLETFELLNPSAYFPRRRSACDTKFGVCQFHKICQVPDDNPLQITTFSAYKEKDQQWKAWS